MISVAPLCHHRELLIELAAARTGVLTTYGHFPVNGVKSGERLPHFIAISTELDGVRSTSKDVAIQISIVDQSQNR